MFSRFCYFKLEWQLHFHLYFKKCGIRCSSCLYSRSVLLKYPPYQKVIQKYVLVLSSMSMDSPYIFHILILLSSLVSLLICIDFSYFSYFLDFVEIGSSIWNTFFESIKFFETFESKVFFNRLFEEKFISIFITHAMSKSFQFIGTGDVLALITEGNYHSELFHECLDSSTLAL